MQRSWSVPVVKGPRVSGVRAGLVAVAAVLSLACSSRPPQIGDYDAEWQARTEAMGKAYETLDVGRIGTYYAPETFTHAFDLPYEWATGQAEKKDTVGAMLAKVENLTFSMTDDVQTWTRRGKVWTLRGVRITNHLKDGRTLDFDGRHSAIWEKREGQWVMIHEHYWGPHRVNEMASAQVPAIAAEPAPAPPVVAPVAPPPATPERPVLVLADIFFDTDKWFIRDDQREALDRNAEILKQAPDVMVLIEGHCDERETIPYNIRLGERRAESTKRYLVDKGVEASRIRTATKGETDPFALGHNEDAWQRNRRSHFVVVGK